MNNRKKTKLEEGKNQVMEYLSGPQGKGALFFGVYLIIFIIIIALFRSNPVPQKETKKKKDITESTYKVSNLEEKNYHFKYTYQTDNATILYEGNSNVHKEFFTRTTDKEDIFYKNNDHYYQTINGQQMEVINPYIYSEFLDIDYIKEILSVATPVAKTEYTEGNKKYSYSIETSALVKIMDRLEVEVLDSLNTIDVIVNESSQVTAINYDLSKYSSYRQEYSKMIIQLEYDKFGEIDIILFNQ